MKFIYLKISLAFVIQTTAITQQNVEDAFSTLQQWYNSSNGLWVPSTGWWNSANCLTVIADLAKVDQTIDAKAQPIFMNTYVRAQQYNLQMQKTISPMYEPQSWYGNQWPWMPAGLKPPPPLITTGFLNDYYDDEGWWALAWIAVYDATGNPEYLQTAESVFEDIARTYGTTPCGGVWWDKAHTYVNAIANELFLDVAAHLANRAGPRSPYYLDWATKQWDWFQNSGMINSEHLVNDGLNNDTCVNNGQTVWSYNQGVILGALAELSRATNDGSYITIAKQIADAAIADLTDSNGVLHDPCEPACGGDGSQFKGVFARNLRILHAAKPEARYQTFLQDNANSIWANDRDTANELSLIWSGPFIQPANASTQSSALDALVGTSATTS